MKTVYLLACVSRKAPTAEAARELYRSPWFRKARAWVEARLAPQDRWFILSAEHGLLPPEQLTAPYEKSLTRMKAPARKAWAARVLPALERQLRPGDHVVFLAGTRYREGLVPAVKALGATVHVPMEGLGIGKQLQWLGRK